ncbi:MAG: hypothetical protein HC782_02625 [Gammaproteobacteria bacterium]|nr:hypothetical protein [Gammaproteobacteria bacterium]
MYPFSTQNASALEHYEFAVGETHGYSGNPLATLDEARRHAGLESPGLILVGDAIGQSPRTAVT